MAAILHQSMAALIGGVGAADGTLTLTSKKLVFRAWEPDPAVDSEVDLKRIESVAAGKIPAASIPVSGAVLVVTFATGVSVHLAVDDVKEWTARITAAMAER